MSIHPFAFATSRATHARFASHRQAEGGMSARCFKDPLGRAIRAACGALKEASTAQRGFAQASTAPPREFPASITNLDGSRGVIRLAGSEMIPFLQGLLTNDVEPLQKPDAAPIYAALLNAQGRQLHDMFLFQSQDGDKPVILVDADVNTLPELKKKLTMYKLRSDVDIADVSDDFSIWTRFGQGRLPIEGWASDPRLERLGQRTVRAKKDKPPAPDNEPETAPLEYKRWRMLHGVAEGDAEMPSGQAVPLEYNMDALNGVSYSKGCYVGQELVARTHNRGVVRKRLMPVIVDGPETEAGAAIVNAADGSETGKIRLADGRSALAHLRLKPALGAAEGEIELRAGESSILPKRPDWWPQEWGREEDAAEAA